MMLSNFNSIKVQLELKPFWTIKTSTIFQFHKGTIRMEIAMSTRMEINNFNSIKVQLELSSGKI